MPGLSRQPTLVLLFFRISPRTQPALRGPRLPHGGVALAGCDTAPRPSQTGATTPCQRQAFDAVSWLSWRDED